MKCPKCGNSGERFEPQQMGMHRGRTSREHRISYCQGDPCYCSVPPTPATGEHLDVICGDCGFPWQESCVDAKP